MASDIEADIAEFAALLSTATRPAVRSVLSAALDQARAARPAIPVPEAPAAGGAPAAAAAEGCQWATPRYSYEQDNDFVTILVFDLPAMSPEVKAGVVCRIEPASVFLGVPHPGAAPGGAAGFRLMVAPLEKEINVAASSFKVKKTQVEIKLRKKTQWEHWASLMAKKGKASADVEKDPGAGLMDMMKDLYNDGTPEMKKTIAEAWTKSRMEQGGGGGGMDL
jgi:calcyclin binding protein